MQKLNPTNFESSKREVLDMFEDLIRQTKSGNLDVSIKQVEELKSFLSKK